MEHSFGNLTPNRVGIVVLIHHKYILICVDPVSNWGIITLLLNQTLNKFFELL